MRRFVGEPKESRIETKLKLISELYDLIFENIEKGSINLKALKQNLPLTNSEKELVICCKKIAEQIHTLDKMAKEYPKEIVFTNTSIRLREVFYEIATLIKEEFRTIRTRNSPVPSLDD